MEKSESEIKYRQIFESSRDAIMLLDRDGFFDCNKSTLRLFEIDSKEEFIQLGPWELSPETQPDGTKSRKAAKEHIEKAYREGESLFEWIHQTVNGENFPAEVKLSRFELDGREVLQALVRDITDQRKLERELRETNEELDAQNQQLQAAEQQLRAEIHERKEREQELKELTVEYETILENVEASVFMVDVDSKGSFRFQRLNRYHEEKTGLTTEYMRGKPPVEAVGEEVGQKVIEKYQQCLEQRETISYEEELDLPGGQRTWLTKLAPVIIDNRVVKLIGSSVDITERKKREEELRETKEKLSGILNNMNDVVWSMSWPDFELLYISPSVKNLYGRSAQEFYDNPTLFKEVTHSDDQHLVEKAIEQLQKEGDAVRECRVVRPDGSITWINDRSKMIYDENNQPIRVEGVARNITERKQRENELATSRQRVNVAKEVSNLGIWENNFQNNETYTDKQWIRLHGRKAESHEDFLSLVHPEDREMVEEAVQKALEKDEDFNFEYRTIIEDELRWISSYGTITRDREGKPQKMIGAVIDVTDQKTKEQQLKRTLSEKETLLKEVHHRVKNNLQVICSLLRLQKFEIEDEASPRVLEAFETSRRRVLSMAKVHNQIYQTDHLAGVDPESYLRDLSCAIIETCDILLEPAVKVDVDPDVNLEIDKAIHTGLILNELISNAIEHAVDESGERLEITIEISPENDKYCLRVADNGCGLEPDFEIAETSSLGLQLVQSLAEDQLAGELNINVDDGTEFEIRFPA